MKVRDIIKEVEAQGWRFDHMRGDHRIFKHPNRKGIVVIPGQPGTDAPTGILASVRRQARGQ